MNQTGNISERIITASRCVFKEVGYQNADMRTIAQKAEIAVGTIYNYFDSKDSLFQEILAREKESFGESMTDLVNNTALSAEEKIIGLSDQAFCLIEDFGAIWREVAGPSLTEAFQNLLQQFTKDKMIINVDVHKITKLFLSSLETLAPDSERKQNSLLISQLFWSGLKRR